MDKKKELEASGTQLDQWREWNKQGFIPGLEETEGAFIERVLFCQNLKQHIASHLKDEGLTMEEDLLAQSILQEVWPLTQECYGIQPQWIPLCFSDKHLSTWHGGCAWIFQLNEQLPTAAFIQLRAHFRTCSTYLGLYQKRELIAHEIAHVGRMLYEEPQFEEMLAYQSSSSWWQRQLGPLIQSSTESVLFIAILGCTLLIDFAFFFFDATFPIIKWVPLIPFAFVAWGLGRLFYRRHLFKKCLHKLESLYGQPQLARHLLYRLRDGEIRQFAHASPSSICTYIHQQASLSFRWRFLHFLYFPSS